jgi:hypothetical protein
MRGDRVLARAFGNEARIVRVLQIDGDTAIITDDEGLNRLNSGEYAAKMTLFPLADLFVYDETVDTGQRPDWSRLTPLTTLLAAGGDE